MVNGGLPCHLNYFSLCFLPFVKCTMWMFLLYIAPVIVIFQVIIIVLLDAPKGDK